MEVKRWMIRWMVRAMALAIPLAMTPGLVQAHALSVVDGNSRIRVQAHDPGLLDWKVDGVDHMVQQWFWFRVGDAGHESPLESLPLIHHNKHGLDTIHLRYMSSLLLVDVLYELEGGVAGSGVSSIDEIVTITNCLPHEIDLRWFEYTNLNVNGTAKHDIATFVAPDTIVQREGLTVATVRSVSPVPTHWQIAHPHTIKGALTDGDPTTLPDSTTPFGPANVAHAFQYNFDDLPSLESVQIHKIKWIEPVPEPGTLALFGLGLVAPLTWRRRKRASTPRA